MNEKYAINDELLDNISGGQLPKNWKLLIDAYAPSYLKQYEGISYEDACALVVQIYPFDNEQDKEDVLNYIKKFFK